MWVDFIAYHSIISIADGIVDRPVPYPIPSDGPVGGLVRSLGRHVFRPAHLHFQIEASSSHAGFQYIGAEQLIAGTGLRNPDHRSLLPRRSLPPF